MKKTLKGDQVLVTNNVIDTERQHQKPKSLYKKRCGLCLTCKPCKEGHNDRNGQFYCDKCMNKIWPARRAEAKR